MPLPPSNDKAVWPPQEWQPILLHMRQWSAWYSGDLQHLQAAYGGGDIQDDTGFFASDKGGFLPTVGRTLQRWFVGEPTRGPARLNKVPIPIGSELCQVSADLLFSDPPTITMGAKEREAARQAKQAAQPAAQPNFDPAGGAASREPAPVPPPEPVDPGQARMDELLDDEFWSRITQGAELAAGLGGTYLLASWAPDVLDRPFTTIRDADAALPEFTYGRLSAVTFWRIVRREKDGRIVWRHLERHEMRAGRYFIQHGLYEGDDQTLGIKVSLDNDPVTAPLADNPDMGMDGAIGTDFDRLMVTYVPNVRPNRLWRSSTQGAYLGRSDLSGVEHLMDQLAEVMSAWMRAVRLSKARIFISKSLLKNAGPGNGVVADLEQEAYTTLDGLGGRDLPLREQVNMVQPEVHWEQYQQTVGTLLEQIVLTAGYSGQTFGVGQQDAVKTATEIQSRERRTLLTRDRKVREWRPALVEHVENLLNADKAYFGGLGITGEVEVVFGDGVQETAIALAQTALALQQSESASLKVRVQALHPDWEDDQVEAEVALIQNEAKQTAAMMAPDPLPADGFGGGSSGRPAAGK